MEARRVITKCALQLCAHGATPMSLEEVRRKKSALSAKEAALNHALFCAEYLLADERVNADDLLMLASIFEELNDADIVTTEDIATLRAAA